MKNLFSVCDRFIAAAGRSSVYLLDVLYVFAQDNGFKLLIDEDGIVMRKYAIHVSSNRDLAKWLKYLSTRPDQNFETVRIPRGENDNERTIFLRAAAAAGDAGAVICWSKSDYSGSAGEFGHVEVLDRDEARIRLQHRGAGNMTIINASGGSQVINQSSVEHSFNKVHQGVSPEAANVIVEVTKIVSEKGSKDDKELLQSFLEELNKQRPKKSLLRSIWSSLVGVIGLGADLLAYNDKIGDIVEGLSS